MSIISVVAPPEPWASLQPAFDTDEQKALVRRAVSAALLEVERVRSCLPSWQRSLEAAQREAGTASPDWANINGSLDSVGASPGQAVQYFAGRDAASNEAPDAELRSLSVRMLLGIHAELLVKRLEEMDRWVNEAKQAVGQSLPERVAKYTTEAIASSAGAMQHSLFITLLGDLREAHVGERIGLAEYCSGWGLSAEQVDMLWTWLTNDALRLGGEALPVALDTQNRAAFRKAESPLVRWLTATMGFTGFVLSFGTVALIFALLRVAHITAWPERWPWKLLVLLLFVTLGAVAHLGSRVLNINYDSPMKVYDAGNGLDWLSLRWVAVIQMYVPITVVVASLWGAGNIPTSFQKLGAAILAGYSADSLIRAATSKLQSQAAKSSTPATPGS